MQLTCGRWYLPNKDPVQCRYPHGGGSGGDDDVNVGGSGEDDGDGTADGGGKDDGVDDALQLFPTCLAGEATSSSSRLMTPNPECEYYEIMITASIFIFMQKRQQNDKKKCLNCFFSTDFVNMRSLPAIIQHTASKE